MSRDELIEKMRTANRGMLDRHDLGVILDAIEGELRAEGLKAVRALVALHAAVARKEGRAEGLRTALVVAQNQNSCAECGGALSMCDSIEALIAKAEAGA